MFSSLSGPFGPILGAANTAGGGTPTLTALSSYGNIVGTTDFTLTATGTFQSGDQIELWNTLLATTYVNSTTLTATVTTAKMASANFGSVRIARGAARSFPLPFEAYPNQTVSSNYVVGLSSAVTPNYGAGGAGTHPAKGTAIAQTFSGSSVRRITSITDTAPAANGVANFRNIYSKWSSINSTGEYIIAEIEDSYTSYLYRLSDGACLGKISGLSTLGGSVGENLEPRWSTRGDEPYTLYYMDGQGGGYGGKKLYKKDIVNGTAEVLVKDFTADLSLGAEYLYCDSEGNPSLDMRRWAFIRRDNAFSGARELLVYDLLTDSYARCKPVTTSGFYVISAGSGSGIVNTNQFSRRPNWVSMSPRGDRVQLGYGRVYPGYGFDDQFGTNVDMPQTFNSSDWSGANVCAVDETHGAWSWGANMEQCWTAQNNRIDTMDVCLDITQPAVFRDPSSTVSAQTFPAANPATNNRRTFIALSGTWNNGYLNEPGQHYMWQMSGVRRGFVFIGTDGTYNANAYGYNNLLCIRISDGRIWRVSNFPHQHADYFSEIQWCIDPFGMSFVGSLNWQNPSYAASPRTRDEVYAIQIDKNWHINAIWS